MENTAGGDNTGGAPKLSNGYAVDTCLHWGTECGKPAADQYCRLNGFAGGAAGFQSGNMRPTWAIGDNRACNETYCTGFTSIECVRGGTGGEINLALNKPARQNSFYNTNPRDMQYGVDGNSDTFSSTSESENNPFWEVDLGAIYRLTEARIYNRKDCCRERLRTLRVLLSNDDANWLPVFTHNGSVFGDDERPLIVPMNTQARYVRIQLNERTILSLAEVEIYGVPPN